MSGRLRWLLAGAIVLLAVVVAAGTVAGATTVDQSRNETVVGTPVTVQTDLAGTPNWTVVASPNASEAQPSDPGAHTTSIRPDEPGAYELQPSPDAPSAAFTVTNRSTVIETYAPVLHFHEDADYRPTRLEALVDNSELRTEDSAVETDPTLFDLADRGPEHYLELDPGVAYSPSLLSLGDRDLAHYLGLAEEEPAYAAYQESYPPTIYANVNENATFEGESYTAVTYWFIYTWDPKHGFAKLGYHQADVESTIVLIDDGEPAYVAPLAHGGASYRPFEQVETTGTHPHLYVEHKSHATYLRNSDRHTGGIQVYSHWGDSGADCDDIVPLASVFHDEHTGTDTSWTPGNGGDVEYELIELTGDEIWSTYEGGLAAAPGSITPPHQRGQYTAAGEHLESRGCPDRELVSGWVEISDTTIDGDEATIDIRVGNDGGMPHEFWVTATADDGEPLESEPVPIGATGPTLFGNPVEKTSLAVESQEDVTVELWLHPPDVRESDDLVDRSVSVDLTDGSWWFW